MSEKQTIEEQAKEFSILLDGFKACKHEFKREGIWVKCKKCNLMYRDPGNKFPIEKANKEIKNR